MSYRLAIEAKKGQNGRVIEQANRFTTRIGITGDGNDVQSANPTTVVLRPSNFRSFYKLPSQLPSDSTIIFCDC